MKTIVAIFMAALAVNVVHAQEALPADHPAIDSAQHGQKKIVTFAEQSAELAADSIRVRVVDAQGNAAPHADILLGIMKSGNSRDKIAKRSDEKGEYLFTGLKTGEGQAYRVSVPFEGATYAAKPFRLEGAQGMDVQIVRLPVTRDTRFIVLALAQLLFEFRDERVHVTQQARLMNFGEQTFLFHKDGMRLKLPKGFTAFQAEAVMSDQRINSDERGLTIEGSLQPGETTLTWSYDIPKEGTEMDIEAPLGFKLYRMRVLAEAPTGLTMKVEGFPDGKLYETREHRVLLSEFERTPYEAPIESIHVTLGGLPGPGPARFIAVALALCVAGAVLVLGLRKKQNASEQAHNIELAKEALVARVLELDKKHAAGDIGPQYYKAQVDELTTSLALLLKEG